MIFHIIVVLLLVFLNDRTIEKISINTFTTGKIGTTFLEKNI